MIYIQILCLILQLDKLYMVLAKISRFIAIIVHLIDEIVDRFILVRTIG
jgi:hypothetical protein